MDRRKRPCLAEEVHPRVGLRLGNLQSRLELIQGDDFPVTVFLELLDAEARLRDDVSLESFIAGFRLEFGIIREL